MLNSSTNNVRVNVKKTDVYYTTRIINKYLLIMIPYNDEWLIVNRREQSWQWNGQLGFDLTHDGACVGAPSLATLASFASSVERHCDVDILIRPQQIDNTESVVMMTLISGWPKSVQFCIDLGPV